MKEINGVQIELHSDDFGQTIHTTSDILDLMKRGHLDGISILPNMPCFDECTLMLKDAIRNKELPFLPVMSIHLDLVEGDWLSDTSVLHDSVSIIPWTWKTLFLASYDISSTRYKTTYNQLKKEIKAQIERVQALINELMNLAEDSGIPYTPQNYRIDSHQHAHMIPIVWKALTDVIEESGYEIEYIRNSHEPLGVFLKHRGCNWRIINLIKNRILALFAPKLERYSKEYNIPQMYLWGLIMSGRMDLDRIKKIMPDMLYKCKKDGRKLELNIHPGLMLKSEMCPEVPEESCRDFYMTADRNVEAETVRIFHDYLDNMKKKLLIIVPTMHQGGQERVVVRTSRLLAPYFDITIVIFDGSDVGYDTTGLNIIDINVPAKPGKINKLINIVKRALKLKKIKKNLRPDISYSYGPSANIINSLSKINNSKTWVGLRNYTDATEQGKMKLCVSKADLIVCCARDIETEVIRRYGEHINTTVLYNLYDIDGIIADSVKEEPEKSFLEWMKQDEDTQDERRTKCKYIMSMGRDDDQKMFWHMLRTFKAIHESVPEARLVILGAGTWEDYKKMAFDLGIAEYVYFAGMQKNPYKYLKYGDINWMTTRNEGFPNALVEGMTLGLAAVSTNALTGPAEILIEGGDTYLCEAGLKDISVGMMTETDELGSPLMAIYGDYGVLTPAMDRNRDLQTDHITLEEYTLSEVMIDLLNDEDKLNKYKVSAAKRAQEFTYDTYLDSFLKLVDMDF